MHGKRKTERERKTWENESDGACVSMNDVVNYRSICTEFNNNNQGIYYIQRKGRLIRIRMAVMPVPCGPFQWGSSMLHDHTDFRKIENIIEAVLEYGVCMRYINEY